jgi:phage terminase large subunit-like protein
VHERSGRRWQRGVIAGIFDADSIPFDRNLVAPPISPGSGVLCDRLGAAVRLATRKAKPQKTALIDECFQSVTVCGGERSGIDLATPEEAGKATRL